MRKSLTPGRTVAWIVLVVLMLLTLFPFYWMLRTALSDNTQLAGHPNSLLPVETTLGSMCSLVMCPYQHRSATRMSDQPSRASTGATGPGGWSSP